VTFQVLHSEVLWPDIEAPVDVSLSCDLFGQAGRYLIWVIGVGPGQPKGEQNVPTVSNQEVKTGYSFLS
jgi:hypothetical protein